MEDLKNIDIKLKDLKQCYRFIVAGLLLIVLCLVLVIINNLIANPIMLLQKIGMPLTFVGMGTTLFGIGKHLHLLHLNILKMNQEKMKM